MFLEHYSSLSALTDFAMKLYIMIKVLKANLQMWTTIKINYF